MMMCLLWCGYYCSESRAARGTAAARPLHLEFSALTLPCGSAAAAETMLTAVLKHRTVARQRLGRNKKYYRKIAQRGDGLVLPPQARRHYETVEHSDHAVQRAVIGGVLGMILLSLMK